MDDNTHSQFTSGVVLLPPPGPGTWFRLIVFARLTRNLRENVCFGNQHMQVL